MATMVGTLEMARHAEAMALSNDAARGGHANVAKNILLFFAAPLIGLAYIVAFPFVGAVAMVRIAVRH